MKKENVQMVPLRAISNKFDVRTALDQDRVLQFAGFYESGMELPPVRLVKLTEDTFAYIDGRTRGAARAYLNLPDVPAIVCNGSLRDNPVELFAEALESNWGGAKPPSRDDITHTVTRMLEHGATQTAIRERLTFLPAGSLKAYIGTARSTIMKRKISKALDSIAEGRSIEEAAQRCGVPVDSLRDVVVGKKRSWRGRANDADLAIALKSYISGQLGACNKGISKKVSNLLAQVENGEASSKTAAGVIKAWREHLRHTSLRIDDWQARLDAIAGEQDKAV